MPKTVTFPDHSPFKLAPAINDKPEGINTGHLDTEVQANLLRIGQDRRYYQQKVQRSDRLRLMLSASALTSISLTIIDTTGAVVDTIATPLQVDVPGNTDDAGGQMTTYLFKAPDYSALTDDGTYYLVLTITWLDAEVWRWRGEPMSVADFHPGTIRIDYRNTTNTDGSYFQQLPCTYTIRVEAAIANMQAVATATVYEDQGPNTVQLDRQAKRQWTLYVGHSGRGIPDWMLDRLNRIFCLNRLLFDGKRYVAAEGADWNRGAGDPLFTASIDITEADGKEGFTFRSTTKDIFTPPTPPYAVSYIIIDGNTIAEDVEIADGTAETAFIAAINANIGDTELLGTVAKTGGVIRYTQGPGESNPSITALVHTNKVDFSYLPPGGVDPLAITIRGGIALINWGDGTMQTYSSQINPTTAARLYGGPGPYTVRIWGTVKVLEISNTSLDYVTGSFPAGMLALNLTGVGFPSNTFDFTKLANTRTTLHTLAVNDAGLTGATGFNSTAMTALKTINFSGNNFNTTVRSAFHYDVWLNASNNGLANGTFSIVQLPFVALNASGAYYKSALQSSPLFWTVNS